MSAKTLAGVVRVALRKRAEREGSLLAVSRATGIKYPTLHGFLNKGNTLGGDKLERLVAYLKVRMR